MNKIETLININQKKGFPRIYRFNPFVRWFTLLLGLSVIGWAIFLIFTKIGLETKFFFKLAPFLIIFFAANSVMRNLFSLNTILFKKDKIVFRFIGRKSTSIYWSSLKKMELDDGKHKLIVLTYMDNTNEKKFSFTLSFPNMMEIVNSIAEMCPGLIYDEFMKNVIISDKERESAKKKKENKLDENDR